MLKRTSLLLSILSSTALAAPYYGGGTSYDRDEGDIITTSPVLQTLSGISLDRGVLTISGGSGNDVASVAPGSLRGTIVAKRGSYTSTFNASDVTKIKFYGNDGDDSFTNTTSIPCEAYGHDGNDVLNGGGGDDFLVGGYGQDTIRGYAGDDTIWGSGGSDWLYGGEGNDLVKGHGGNDLIYGDNGDDRLYGGSGDDHLYGGLMQDTLVSIGGGYDTVSGYYGNDFFWVDSTDWVSDAGADENLGKYINRVASFEPVSYSGGLTSTPIAKDLTDYDLPDPLPDVNTVDLANFGDHPLFASGGPSKHDVDQGSIGDCYLLGPLSAVADATPESIQKLVVDLDDGTYAVRFWREGVATAKYVRVDADLWIKESNQSLEYGGLGVQGSIWLPIVEKAWAIFRQQDSAYSSISGGNASGSGTVAMGANNETNYTIPETYDAADIIAWNASGRPAGAIANYVQSEVTTLLNWIEDHKQDGYPVYTGYYGTGVTNSTAINDVDYWRRGRHIIMVDDVGFDANGNPISLTIRDQNTPSFVTFTDFARIYFFFGRARLYEMP